MEQKSEKVEHEVRSVKSEAILLDGIFGYAELKVHFSQI